MIDPTKAVEVLSGAGVDFFTGVPDSLLKEFNACVAQRLATQHVVAQNEGGAVSLAAGHFLATGSLALVYMQNSGLGNAVNPLVSLSSDEVYGIPMLLMIGWRGQPGTHDEPQHLHQGRVTEEMLTMLDIPFYRLTAESEAWEELLDRAVNDARSAMRPVALLISAGTFSKFQGAALRAADESLPSRADAIAAVLDRLPSDTVYIATTGYTARELSALRAQRGENSDRDFLVVGSMGHAATVALGLARARQDVAVVCLDGDGSVAMHMGSLAVIGKERPENLGHILFNNRVHESVGGQPSAFATAQAQGIARACGYRSSSSCSTLEGLNDRIREQTSRSGPWFIEVEVGMGAPRNLPRPEGFHDRRERLRSSLEK